MNVLLTSAGRRGYMVEYFKKALNGIGKVHVGNSSAISPAFYYADYSVVTPLIYEDEYIPFILHYCLDNNITMIVSLFDIDLMILAKNKKLFADNEITVVVSDESVIKICNDKWETYRFCIDNGIDVAKTYNCIENAKKELETKELSFPLIIKPRWGMGSLAIYQANDMTELEVFYNKTKKNIVDSYLKYESELDFNRCVLIQEKLSGQEYGMDVMNDLNGDFCANVVRKKYAMRSGETDCAIVVSSKRIDDLAQKLSKLLHHIGNMDVDLFVTDNKIYLLELNARFGGGYPFSHMAGVDLPKAIVKWVLGTDLEDELIIKKYEAIIQKDIQLIDISEFIVEK